MGPPRLVLYSLTEFVTYVTLPARYRQAHDLFDRATADYEKGESEKAGAEFLEVATLLAAPPSPTAYSEEFASCRRTAYKNVVVAYTDAKNLAGARKALSAAILVDRENNEFLLEQLDALKKAQRAAEERTRAPARR